MAYSYTPNVFSLTKVAVNEKQQISDNFEAIRQNFYGSTEPPSVIAGQFWFNSTAKVLASRYGANWLGYMTGSTSQKIWIYRNDSMIGWQIDTSVKDVVLSVKSDSGAYSSAGSLGGEWGGADHLHTGMNHSHRWASGTMSASWNSVGNNVSFIVGYSGSGTKIAYESGTYALGMPSNEDAYTETSTANTALAGIPSSWRPRAAVGTLQHLIYPNAEPTP